MPLRPADWFENWLRRRLPRSRALRLDQRRIFILPTRNGLYYLLMVFAIFLGGINYGNSLILGVAFLLVSLFLVSILHTWANLSGLLIRAGRAQPAFAGEEAAFELSLETAARRGHEAIRLSWEDALPQYLDLPPRGEARATLLLPVTRRGLFRPGRLKLESCFPLGLLRAWSWVDLDMAALVYPRPLAGDYPHRFEDSGPEGQAQAGEGSDDFEGLRAYRPGDSPRRLAWRQYARSGELHAKVFVSRRSRELWLEWEAFAGEGVETRLSRLCHWVCRLSEEGVGYGLRLPGCTLPPATGRAHEQACLRALALYGQEAA